MRDPYYILMQDGQVLITDMNGNHVNTIPQDIFDEIVVMRYHNMTQEEETAAINKILNEQFEIGADGVRKAHDLPTVMERAMERIDGERTSPSIEKAAERQRETATEDWNPGPGAA